MSRRLGVSFLLLVPVLAAQTADDAIVPMREERYHRLLFENARVAVYDVVFPVGATMRFHEHPTDHLAVIISPGTLRNEVKGAPAPLVRPPGPVGELVFLPAGPPHRQVNVGETTVHFVAAEILSQAAAAPAAASTPNGSCTQELDNAAVRAVRCKLLPGDAATGLAHPGGFLRIVVAGDRAEWRPRAGGREALKVEPGAASWHDAAEAGTLANVGRQPFEALDIEWK